MPNTMLDAESAYLSATAAHKTWLAEFMAAWTAPLRDAIVVRWWDQLTPERRAALKAADPQKYAEAERVVQGLRPQGVENA